MTLPASSNFGAFETNALAYSSKVNKNTQVNNTHVGLLIKQYRLTNRIGSTRSLFAPSCSKADIPLCVI